MKNVALVGNLATGKSTIANVLTDSGFQRLSLAGPLKNTASLAYGPIEKGQEYTVDALDGTQHTLSGRQILQNIGQTIKQVDRSFWLKAFLRDADNYLDAKLVCEDVRFIFEADALRARDWLIVGIDTPLEVRMQRAETLYGRRPTEAELNHESELEVPGILADADIIVSGINDPYENVKLILNQARSTE